MHAYIQEVAREYKCLNHFPIIFAVLALMFVPLGSKGVSVPAIRLHFNMYTGPAYLSGLLDIVNIVLLVVLFRDCKIEHKTMKDSQKKSTRESIYMSR